MIAETIKRNDSPMLPETQAKIDFADGMGIDQNPFYKNSDQWHEYRAKWNDLYLNELHAEQAAGELDV